MEARNKMKLQELKGMAQSQREKVISKLGVESLKAANGQMGPLHAKLRELEVRYEMSTKDMLVEFNAGKLKDTPDISRWVVLSRGLGGR